jgi:hypothetical protein
MEKECPIDGSKCGKCDSQFWCTFEDKINYYEEKLRISMSGMGDK